MDYGQHGDQWEFISKPMIFSLMLADLKDSISIATHLFDCQNLDLLQDPDQGSTNLKVGQAIRGSLILSFVPDNFEIDD